MIEFTSGPGVPLLVVDDEAPIRRAIGRHLERMGYEVVTAATATEARLELERRVIALALCDIDMPGARDEVDVIRGRFSDNPSSSAA